MCTSFPLGTILSKESMYEIAVKVVYVGFCFILYPYKYHYAVMKFYVFKMFEL